MDERTLTGYLSVSESVRTPQLSATCKKQFSDCQHRFAAIVQYFCFVYICEHLLHSSDNIRKTIVHYPLTGAWCWYAACASSTSASATPWFSYTRAAHFFRSCCGFNIACIKHQLMCLVQKRNKKSSLSSTIVEGLAQNLILLVLGHLLSL